MGTKYVGGDVHSQFTAFVVLDGDGKLLSQTEVPTRGAELESFARSLGGDACVAVEEGTQSYWLLGVMSPYVREMMVCDPRHVSQVANRICKSDFRDAWDLADGVRAGVLRPVYKGYSKSVRVVHQLSMSYGKLAGDVQRTKSRLNSVFLGAGVPERSGLYGMRNRSRLLGQVKCAGARSRAEFLYAELDMLEELKKEALARISHHVISEARF